MLEANSYKQVGNWILFSNNNFSPFVASEKVNKNGDLKISTVDLFTWQMELSI